MMCFSVEQGRYKGSRKNGDGTYCFLNQDVYEGEFKDDRMAGCGVYSFAPEGRWDGWPNTAPPASPPFKHCCGHFLSKWSPA